MQAQIQDEIQHHGAWAATRNLKLNVSKTQEIVIYKNKKIAEPTSIHGVNRVNSIKILGVIVDKYLTFSNHISETIKSCGQAFFALKTMKQHGLSKKALQNIFCSKILPKLLYASQSWWGFAPKSAIDQMGAFLRRARRFGYNGIVDLSIEDLLQRNDFSLFNSIKSNPQHCLFALLPPIKSTTYSLRSKGHDFNLPDKDSRNFINRSLYCFI